MKDSQDSPKLPNPKDIRSNQPKPGDGPDAYHQYHDRFHNLLAAQGRYDGTHTSNLELLQKKEQRIQSELAGISRTKKALDRLGSTIQQLEQTSTEQSGEKTRREQAEDLKTVKEALGLIQTGLPDQLHTTEVVNLRDTKDTLSKLEQAIQPWIDQGPTERLNTIRQRVDGWQSDLKQTEQEFAKLNAQMEENKEAKAKLGKNLSALRSAGETIEEIRASESKNAEGLKKLNKALGNIQTGLPDQLHTTEVVNLRDTMDTLSKLEQAIQPWIDQDPTKSSNTIRQRVNSWHSDLKQTEQELAKLSTHMEGNEEAKAMMDITLYALKSAMEVIEEIRASESKNAKGLKKVKKALENIRIELPDQLHTTEVNLRGTKDALSKLEQAIQPLIDQDPTEKLDKAQERVDGWQSDLKQTEQELAKLNAQMGRNEGAKAELDKNLSALKRAKKAMEDISAIKAADEFPVSSVVNWLHDIQHINQDSVSQELVRDCEQIIRVDQAHEASLKKLPDNWKKVLGGSFSQKEFDRYQKIIKDDYKIEQTIEILPEEKCDPDIRALLNKIKKIDDYNEAGKTNFERYRLAQQTFDSYTQLYQHCLKAWENETAQFKKMTAENELYDFRVSRLLVSLDNEETTHLQEVIDLANRTQAGEVVSTDDLSSRLDNLSRTSIENNVKKLFEANYREAHPDSTSEPPYEGIGGLTATMQNQTRLAQDFYQSLIKTGGNWTAESHGSYQSQLENAREGAQRAVEKHSKEVSEIQANAVKKMSELKTYAHYLNVAATSIDTILPTIEDTRKNVAQELETTTAAIVSLDSIGSDIRSKTEDLDYLGNKQKRLQGKLEKLQTIYSQYKRNIEVGEASIYEQNQAKAKGKAEKKFEERLANLLSRVSQKVNEVLPSMQEAVNTAITQVEGVIEREVPKLKSELNKTQRALDKVEPAATKAARELEGTQEQANEARSKVDTSEKDIIQRGKDMFIEELQKLAPSSDRQTYSSNDFIQQYQDRWSEVQPITDSQLGSIDLRDRKYVKDSLEILTRLDDLSNENPSKEAVWKLYGSVIDNTISSWNNPPSEGAGRHLAAALKTLNKANTLASGFLDW